MLNKLVDTIDERDAEIIAQYYFAGMNQGQIAESLGISRRSVTKRLKKLRNRVVELWPEESRDV